MSIFRHGDGWRAKVYLNGKVVASKAGFATKSLAKKWHDDTRYSYGDVTKAPPTRTFAELLHRYEEEHLGKQSAGTQLRYRIELDRIAQFFRYMPAQPTLDALDAFREHLRQTVSPKTANYCMVLLSGILKRGVRWRWIEKRHSFELFQLPKSESPYEWWDDRTYIAKFLEHARKKSRFFKVYYTLLATGMRCGEGVGLWKPAVSFERSRIHVCRKWDPANLTFSLPKGGKERWLDFNPKGQLAEVLWDAVEESRHEFLVFPSAEGGPLSRTNFADKALKRLCREAGVPVISAHGLRHTFASWYMIEHDDIWTLKEILGHTDIKTTMIYARHSAKLRKTPLDLETIIAHESPTNSRPLVVGL